jgi:hypothetical protein
MTQILRVQTRHGVTEFANAAAAGNYCRKWGGVILAANEPSSASVVSRIGSQTTKSSNNPFTKTLLGLPANASASEYEKAWQANGLQCAVRHAPAVREALILLAMKEQNFSRSRAEDYALDRYPLLHAEALKKIGTGLNERQAANEVLALGPTVKH